MLHNSKIVLQEKNDLNPITNLWHKVSSSPILNNKLLGYIKLVKIVTIQVLSSIEDKQTFNIVNFMKNKFQNHLSTRKVPLTFLQCIFRSLPRPNLSLYLLKFIRYNTRRNCTTYFFQNFILSNFSFTSIIIKKNYCMSV